MSENTHSDISIALIAKDRLLRAGLHSLLSEKGCLVNQAGPDLDSMDLSNGDIFEESIFVMVDSQNREGAIFSEMTQLIKLNKDAKIVVISGYDNGNYLERCFQSGAVGYILMSSSEEVLMDCMRLVRLGQNVFPSEFVKWIAQSGDSDPNGPERWARPVSLNILSRRDCQILQMLVSGLSNKEIGLNFQIPDTSVKVLLKRLSNRIGVTNRVQAAVWAVTNGLAPYDEAETLDRDGEHHHERINGR